MDVWPVWTPDGRQVAFSSNRAGANNLYRRAADGTGPVERLTTSSDPQTPFTFSPDGKTLTFGALRLGTSAVDLGALSMDGDGAINWLFEGPSNEFYSQISPDGRWIAYVSNESGRNEVYVRPFPNLEDGRWQISTTGGVSPRWGPDSRELFYRELEPGFSGSNTIMMTVNDTNPTFNPGTPRRLFDGIYRTDFPTHDTWDITSDGERFLMIKDEVSPDTQTAAGQVIVVQNWTEELTRLVPVGR